MSGLEVAGVVLAVLPLIDKALKSYSASASLVKTIINYKLQYEELSIRFDIAYTMYRASCEQLISPLAISPGEKEELIEHPNSPRWKDPHLRIELKKRLGLRYNSYLAATQIVQSKVEKLKRRLKLSDEYLPSWIKKSGSQLVEDETKRTEFFSRKGVKEIYRLVRCQAIIEDISQEIERIGSFIENATKLEAPRRERRAQIDSNYWLVVRDHAKRVFKSLESRLTCPCSCEHFHQASLQLRIESESSQTEFRVKCILSLEKNPGSTLVPPWKWRGIEIEPERVDSPQVRAVRSGAPSVRFTASTSSAPNTSPTPSSKPNSRKNYLAPEILDICQTLKSPSNRGPCIGYLNDDPWRFHIHESIHRHQSPSIRKIMSLREIMNKRLQSGVTCGERIAVALRLAVAVLQLHGTPWISSNYGLGHLFFPTNGSAPEIPLFEPAYVSRTFITANVASVEPPIVSEARIRGKNPLVYALGVSLMELVYGRLPALAKSSELDPQGNETPNTEMLVAVRLLKQIRDDEPGNYAHATASCVHCEFGYPYDHSLDDDQFRAKFIERVIIPLKEDYDAIASARGRVSGYQCN